MGDMNTERKTVYLCEKKCDMCGTAKNLKVIGESIDTWTRTVDAMRCKACIERQLQEEYQ